MRRSPLAIDASPLRRREAEEKTKERHLVWRVLGALRSLSFSRRYFVYTVIIIAIYFIASEAMKRGDAAPKPPGWSQRTQLDADDAAKALKHPVLATLANDYNLLRTAQDQGELADAVQPRSKFSKDIANLSDLVFDRLEEDA